MKPIIDKKYFKVLATKTSREDFNKSDRVSCTAIGYTEVVYKPEEWAEAPAFMQEIGYHLLVFDNSFAALEFCSEFSSYEIWTCEIEDEITPLPPRFDFYSLIDYGYDLENNPESHLKPSVNGEWPSRTVMAKRVKILERIEWIEESKVWILSPISK